MDILAVVIATITVSALTFLSGFGLGTLLLPVFILFFPVGTAIAVTAIVHLANNVFKAILVGRQASWSVVLKFALPAALAAIVGALLLKRLGDMSPWMEYSLWGHQFAVTPIKALIAALMAAFSLLEFLPATKTLSFSPKLIPLGGAISGFFGGLSGHQGALRAAFLVRLGLDKNAFIGTTILSAIVVDVSRLAVYGATFLTEDFDHLLGQGKADVIIASVIAAFLGAVAGYFLMKKITLNLVHRLVGVLLVLYAFALGAGFI